MIRRILAVLGVALLVLIGGATAAGAAPVRVAAEEKSWQAMVESAERSDRDGTRDEFWASFNDASAQRPNAWALCDHASIAADRSISPDTGGAVMEMWVSVPRHLRESTLEADFNSADCGFERFFIEEGVDNVSSADVVSDKVVSVDFGLLTARAGDEVGGYGGSMALSGETSSGADLYVHIHYSVQPALVEEPPFTPETGEPEPTPEPEPEPTPEVTPDPEPEPSPEPSPEPPVVPVVPEDPEVPEVPEEPAPPVVDEPEPAVPFAPDTGIEVDEPSSPLLGWVLIGSGLSLGAAAWFAARRWL